MGIACYGLAMCSTNAVNNPVKLFSQQIIIKAQYGSQVNEQSTIFAQIPVVTASHFFSPKHLVPFSFLLSFQLSFPTSS